MTGVSKSMMAVFAVDAVALDRPRASPRESGLRLAVPHSSSQGAPSSTSRPGR